MPDEEKEKVETAQIQEPAPVPTAAQVPPCPGGFLYEIRSGDTFYALARRFGVSIEAIMVPTPLTPEPANRPARMHPRAGATDSAPSVLPGRHALRNTQRRHAVADRAEIWDYSRCVAEGQPWHRPEKPPDRPGHLHPSAGAYPAADMSRWSAVRDRTRRHPVAAGSPLRHNRPGDHGRQPRPRPQQVSHRTADMHTPGADHAACVLFHPCTVTHGPCADGRRLRVGQNRRDRNHSASGVGHQSAVTRPDGGQLVHSPVHLGRPAH